MSRPMSSMVRSVIEAEIFGHFPVYLGGGGRFQHKRVREKCRREESTRSGRVRGVRVSLNIEATMVLVDPTTLLMKVMG